MCITHQVETPVTQLPNTTQTVPVVAFSTNVIGSGFDDIDVHLRAKNLLETVKKLDTALFKGNNEYKSMAFAIDCLYDGLKKFVSLESKYPATTAKVYSKRIVTILNYTDAVATATQYLSEPPTINKMKKFAELSKSLHSQILRVYENNKMRAKKLTSDATNSLKREHKKELKKREKAERKRNDSVMYNVWTTTEGSSIDTARLLVTITGKQLRKLSKKLNK